MVGLTATAVIAGALPADAHPSFASSPTVNFLPNALGGTGAAGVAPPYIAGSSPVIVLRLPDEIGTTFPASPATSPDDNTVEAKVRIPAGWTNPACGAVKKQINNAFTFNTNQPGDAATGWTCAIEDVDGHKVLHWTGPQAATSADAAQFFEFTVTAPSPTTPTRYGSLPGSGFATGEGFVVDQIYASGAGSGGAASGIKHWVPPNDPSVAGITPAPSNIASGLLRTVSAPGATGSGAGQTINAVVPATGPGGAFSLSVPTSGAIGLTPGTPTAGYFPFAGALNAMSLTDTRAAGPGWSVSGVASAFNTLSTDSAKYLGWTPKVLTAGASAVAGGVVLNALDTTAGPGLQTAQGLATGTSGAGTGTASLGADLNLKLPASTPPGTYSATLTLTAI